VAKGKKTGGRDYPKGVSGNPAGRPPVPSDLLEARALTPSEFDRIANKLLELTKDELNSLLKNDKTPAKVVMLARIIRSAMWSSDPKRAAFFLDRLIGKPQHEGAAKVEARAEAEAEERRKAAQKKAANGKTVYTTEWGGAGEAASPRVGGKDDE
jgi:hypothetical protein